MLYFTSKEETNTCFSNALPDNVV